MIRLVLAHMADRPMPVTLNAILIAFAGALLLTLVHLSEHIQTRFERDMAGIDLVVSAKGSPLQVILSSLFHVDVPTGNIDYAAAKMLAKDPLVKQAIPIAIGDRFRGYRVVGAPVDYLSLYGAEAAQGAINIEEENAVIGASAARALGIQLGQKFAVTHGLGGEGGASHDSHPLKVSAILAPTGSVIDRLIITSLDAIWEAHGIHGPEHDEEHDDGDDHDHDHHHQDAEAADHEDHENHHDHHENDEGHEDDHHHEAHEGHEHDADHGADKAHGRPPEVTAVLVRYASPLAVVQLPQKINQNTALMAAVPAYETTRLLDLFGVSRDLAEAITIALITLSAFAIFASLWSALDGREGDVALYRLMGMQRRQIFTLLIMEGKLTALFGAIGAWLIARLCLWQLSAGLPALSESGLSVAATSAMEAVVLVGILSIGALAAVPAGIKAARMSLERALA